MHYEIGVVSPEISDYKSPAQCAYERTLKPSSRDRTPARRRGGTKYRHQIWRKEEPPCYRRSDTTHQRSPLSVEGQCSGLLAHPTPSSERRLTRKIQLSRELVNSLIEITLTIACKFSSVLLCFGMKKTINLKNEYQPRKAGTSIRNRIQAKLIKSLPSIFSL